jgi:hypothetical protein
MNPCVFVFFFPLILPWLGQRRRISPSVVSSVWRGVASSSSCPPFTNHPLRWHLYEQSMWSHQEGMWFLPGTSLSLSLALQQRWSTVCNPQIAATLSEQTLLGVLPLANFIYFFPRFVSCFEGSFQRPRREQNYFMACPTCPYPMM